MEKKETVFYNEHGKQTNAEHKCISAKILTGQTGKQTFYIKTVNSELFNPKKHMKKNRPADGFRTVSEDKFNYYLQFLNTEIDRYLNLVERL
jgi:hypothetical protein